jgi:hypothetical protein
VRLLYLDPAAWPAGPDGGFSVSVPLSDRRVLEARLTYVDSAPTVQVVYRDPLMAPETSATFAQADAEGGGLVDEGRGESRPRESRGEGARRRRGVPPHVAAWHWLKRLKGLKGLKGLLGRFTSPFTSLRPGAVAAVLAVLVVAALLFTRLYAPPVSAAELLHRAAAASRRAGIVVRPRRRDGPVPAPGRGPPRRR